jgi:hypothetical protein
VLCDGDEGELKSKAKWVVATIGNVVFNCQVADERLLDVPKRNASRVQPRFAGALVNGLLPVSFRCCRYWLAMNTLRSSLRSGARAGSDVSKDEEGIGAVRLILSGEDERQILKSPGVKLSTTVLP